VADICRVPGMVEGNRLQTTYFLIRKCVLTQITYFNRVCPPECNLGAAREMDKMMIDKISSLLQIQKYLPSPESEEYAHYQQRFQLPISMGGDGFISMQSSRAAAYVGSFALVAHHMALIHPRSANNIT
jgi:hypothetical protein